MPSLAHPHKTERSTELPVAVVAGGAGFLGSTLCETLLTQNCQVIAIDNLKTGKIENLNNCQGKNNFYFIEADINKETPTVPHNVTYIFHLAGVEEYINGLDLSLETLLVNSLGTKNLLELAQANNSKFLLASTLEIFQAIFSSWSIKKNLGIGDKENQAMSHHEAKRYAEAITTEYFKKFDLDTRIVRLLDVYGPKMDLEAGTEIARMLKEASLKNKISIQGDGLKSLRPTYISDVVYGITKAMFAQNSKGKIYTLVNPKSVSILNFAYEIKKQKSEELKIEFQEGKNELPDLEHDSEVEIEKTIEDLGWRPKVGYEEGISLTLDYIKEPKEEKSENKKEKGLNEEATNIITIGESEFKSEAGNQSQQTKTPKLPKIKFHKPSFPKFKFLKKISKSTDEEQTKSPKSKKKKKLLFILLTILLVISFGILYPALSFINDSKSGADSLKKTKSLLNEAKLDEASREIEKANSSFTNAKEDLDRMSLLADLLNQNKRKEELSKALDVAAKGTSSIDHIIKAASPVTKIAQGLDGSVSVNVREEINTAKIELEKGSDEIGEVVAILKKSSINTGLWPISLYSKEIEELTESISQAQIFLGKIRSLSLSTPELLGLNGRRNYLFLFQNNMELRATGGFIGSYGILSLNDGKLLDLKIQDVYQADGQLKGKIFPPGPITKYMGQPNWYLRDSNYSPDFITSAQKAEYFLEKETGELVDGVIAIDIDAIKEILRAVGPIPLPEYKETITAENLYEKTQVYSEKDFFPGSTQKKDFLSVLNERLLGSLFQSPKSKWLNLVAGVNKSLNEKHIQAYFHDGNLSRLMSEFNWDGHVPIFTPANSDCLSLGVTCDYLGVVDSNFGANKANAFLKRSLNHEIVFGRSGEIEEKVTIKYENQSPSNAWPAGTYKNYLRVYVPQNSTLLRVDFDDKKASISAHTDTEKPKTKEGELDVEVATESAKTSYGFYFEVPFNSQKTVSVSYRLPYNLSFSKDTTNYKFYWQKQAGTSSDNLNLIVNYPSFYRIGSLVPSPTGKNAQKLEYNQSLDTDKKYSIELAK